MIQKIWSQYKIHIKIGLRIAMENLLQLPFKSTERALEPYNKVTV